MAASQFAPAKITASVGQTIRWTNSDAIAHTATATEGAGFDSGTIEGGGEFTYTTREGRPDLLRVRVPPRHDGDDHGALTSRPGSVRDPA